MLSVRYPRRMAEASSRVTLRTLRHRVRDGRPLAMLTCYDATTARWLARGGVDLLLVGDTAGSVILGHDDTIHAPLDFMLQLTAAVRRGAPDAFVMGDMPWMSYQGSDDDAVRNAARFMLEGRADAVKLEVDGRFTGLIEKLDRANIPAVAHIGWTPQRTAMTGVPVMAGRTAEKTAALVDTAKAVADAGAVMLLLECATDDATAAVVDAVDVPVIGCGAGPACHGKVVVLHDWLGLTDWQPPFAPPLLRGGESLKKAAEAWLAEVDGG